MNGYVARKGNRWYAVIYEGLDPVTGREIRRWHAAGADKASAERLARRLARELNGPADRGRGLTFGAFLTRTWLPAKRIELRPTTWHGYQRIAHRHVLPALGSTQIRRLRPEQLEDLYESKLVVAGLKHLGSIANPEFFEKQRMRFSTWDTPRFISAYHEDLEWLHLPRGVTDKVDELGRKSLRVVVPVFMQRWFRSGQSRMAV